jgi:hypothetical protein
MVSTWTTLKFKGQPGGGEPLEPQPEVLLQEATDVLFHSLQSGDFIALVAKPEPSFPQCYWLMRVSKTETLAEKTVDNDTNMEFEEGSIVVSGVYLEYAPEASRKKGSPPTFLRDFHDRAADYMVESHLVLGTVPIEPRFDQDGDAMAGNWVFSNAQEQHDRLKALSKERRSTLEEMGFL